MGIKGTPPPITLRYMPTDRMKDEIGNTSGIVPPHCDDLHHATTNEIESSERLVHFVHFICKVLKESVSKKFTLEMHILHNVPKAERIVWSASPERSFGQRKRDDRRVPLH